MYLCEVNQSDSFYLYTVHYRIAYFELPTQYYTHQKCSEPIWV